MPHLDELELKWKAEDRCVDNFPGPRGDCTIWKGRNRMVLLSAQLSPAVEIKDMTVPWLF